MAQAKNYLKILARPLKRLRRYWQASWWHKVVASVALVIALAVGGMYGIALWYQHSERSKPLQLGVSFIPDYATYLGLDPQATMDALLNDLHVREFRLTSYWKDVEPTQGVYDFSQLDWQFAKAEAAHAHVILTVGLRQPRWPECHPPDWLDTTKPASTWQPQLERYMTAVINRYKHSPALESYQLENEYFLVGFGDCTDMSRNRLVREYNLVKQLDPAHPIIVGRSNNGIGTPIGQPTPDEFSISVYQRVWDATVTHRYLQYPFPSWYYAFLAGVQKVTKGKDMVLGELQAEPWPPKGQDLLTSSLAEQSKSFNAKRLQATVDFGESTGMRTINLWGAEYWYYRMVTLHDPSVWNTARQIFSEQ